LHTNKCICQSLFLAAPLKSFRLFRQRNTLSAPCPCGGTQERDGLDSHMRCILTQPLAPDNYPFSSAAVLSFSAKGKPCMIACKILFPALSGLYGSPIAVFHYRMSCILAFYLLLGDSIPCSILLSYSLNARGREVDPQPLCCAGCRY